MALGSSSAKDETSQFFHSKPNAEKIDVAKIFEVKPVYTLSSYTVGMSYTIGKLLNPAFQCSEVRKRVTAYLVPDLPYKKVGGLFLEPVDSKMVKAFEC